MDAENSGQEYAMNLSIQEAAPNRPAEVLSPRLSASLNSAALLDEFAAETGTEPPPPVSFKSVLLQFLKGLASSGTTGDLHQLTCPAIMLNGISLLEYGIHWAEYPRLIADISKPADPVERMVAVCRWFISCLHGSYASRSKTAGFERKPYNPILGEQFFARWLDEHGFGETELIAEQVSHHPPVTGFHLANRQAGVYISGSNGQQTSLTGTAIRVDQLGRIFVYLDRVDEEYMITLPQLHVRGLLTGSPFLELTGEVVIIGTTGVGARLKFIPKPWFSGEYDGMEGIIAGLGDDREDDAGGRRQHYELWGKWSERVWIKAPNSEKASVLFDIGQVKRDMLPVVKPVVQQGELESRRVWFPVTKALKQSDYAAANAAKSAIENEQRAIRRERAERDEAWQPQHFQLASFCFMPGKEASVQSSTASDAVSTTEGTAPSPTSSSRSSVFSTGNGSQSTSNGGPQYEGRWVLKSFYQAFVEPRMSPSQ